MAMKSRRAILACLTAGMFCQTVAFAEDYAFDLKKKNPGALAAWMKIVPTSYRKSDSIDRLDGTTTPMDQVTMQGKVFYYGSVCQPHDCAGNNVAFLIAEDGSAAYGMLSSNNFGVKARIFGAPDAEARQLLTEKLSQ
jgi:Inhibitor of vertebrate lysozyme (Ivy)